MPNYWLMKSEPGEFSFDDLRKSPDSTVEWDGVRNFQARNHMKAMKLGDRVLFYHSSTKPQAIVGLASESMMPAVTRTASTFTTSPWWGGRRRSRGGRASGYRWS